MANVFQNLITYRKDLSCPPFGQDGQTYNQKNFARPFLPSTIPSTSSGDLRHLHTFGLEADCQGIYKLKGWDDFKTLDPKIGKKALILGGGSNVAFVESFEGLVLLQETLGRHCLEKNGEGVIVRCGAGENWHDLLMWTLAQGWCGLENLALIPGTVGAAPIQNIGAYGRELKDVLKAVHVWDRTLQCRKSFSREECRLAYRDSLFKTDPDRYCVMEVDLELSLQPQLHLDYGDIRKTLESKNILQPTAMQVAEAVCSIRKSKLPDPIELGNAGSFFKNPVVSQAQAQKLKERFPAMVAYDTGDGSVKLAAGWLIDRLGWRGQRVGGMGVHERQALVLVNHGNGRGRELLQLARDIQESVRAEYGVELSVEVNLIDAKGRMAF